MTPSRPPVSSYTKERQIRGGRRHPLTETPDTVTDEYGLAWEYADQIDPLWPMARRVALRRDHHTCRRCGAPGSDVHHRVARGKGGRQYDGDRHAPERLVTLCRACHGWVHAHPTEAKTGGYTVPDWDDPTTVPVSMYHGVAILGQDGRMETLTVRYR